jgi:hypothetical protein
MRTPILITAASALAVALAALTGQASAAPASPAAASTAARTAAGRTLAGRTAARTAVHTRRACAAAPVAGHAECLAVLRTTATGAALPASAASASSLPIGYGPAQIQSAYELATAAAAQGSGQTVALVDAYDDPNAEADLANYRAEYELPACTTDNGCFRKVNQAGQAGPLPAANAGWALEESLDVDMVSAVCPQCHILLAEANSNSDHSLAVTVRTAARLGATQISNSYGAAEHPAESNLEKFYDQPGAAVTAAAGDSGYGVSYPAASRYVTAVGGTTLWPASNSRGWTESAWAGSGSGCSTQIGKPAWQHDACTHRIDNDVAAVADPGTPVAVYDSYQASGWVDVGGTSVGSPLIASVYALLGEHGQDPGGSYYYTHPKNLFPVTSGSNGNCDPAYLCTAGDGYSGPAGLGTPDFTGVPVTGGSCPGGWSLVPAQPLPAGSSQITDTQAYTWDSSVAVLSANDVWTAGTYQDEQSPVPAVSSGYLSTLEHWDGSRWTQFSSPNFSNGTGLSAAGFTGLSFDSPSDGWAVGYHLPSASLDAGAPLVTHWDGHAWTASPVLDPPRLATSGGVTWADWALPDAVAAISPDDVWLAGWFETSSGSLAPDGSFLEHWDGSAWSVVSFPARKTIHLTSLDALSADDVWAVGNTTNGPLALHWDGSTWTRSAFAGPRSLLTFTSVSGSAPDDLWAVGERYIGTPGGIPENVPYTEHWNGTAWAAVPVTHGGSVAGPATGFNSVTTISPTDAWAVGQWWGPRGTQWESNSYLLAHWNGQQWTIQPEPQSASPFGLTAVAARGPSDIWVTGEQKVTAVGNNPTFSPYLIRYRCGHR